MFNKRSKDGFKVLKITRPGFLQRLQYFADSGFCAIHTHAHTHTPDGEGIMESSRVRAPLPTPPEEDVQEEKVYGNVLAELESVDLPLGTTLR